MGHLVAMFVLLHTLHLWAWASHIALSGTLLLGFGLVGREWLHKGCQCHVLLTLLLLQIAFMPMLLHGQLFVLAQLCLLSTVIGSPFIGLALLGGLQPSAGFPSRF
jgi:hypothetical protein